MEEEEKLHKNKVLERIEKKLDEIGLNMEKMKLVEYVAYLEHPRKLIWSNFVSGVARGVGTVIGVTVVMACILYFLRFLLTLNLPLVSSYIADFIRLIQNELNK